MKRKLPRRALHLIATLAVLAAVVAVARWPVTTSVGVDYEVTVKRLTLFEKAMGFVSRDLEMRRLAKEVAGVGGTPEQRLFRMYDWVTRNIHPVPPGFPVVDDHVLHIFVRRYGTVDQRAEALAALASYDGMPATALGLGKKPRYRPVQLTVVKVGDRLLVFDVNHDIVFRKASGELATLSDLVADPSIVRAAGRGVMVGGAPYHEHFQRLGEMTPSFQRMAQQRFWPRVKDEFITFVIGE